MRLLLSSTAWVKALAIALLFTACAISVRTYWGYPRCQNDELNWVQIAYKIEAGQDWPVSGPFFMYILRSLKHLTQMRYLDILSNMGILSVFIGSIFIILGYLKLRISAPGITLVTLSLSSYFWAPLLEARPQQWGQIQVFLGAICAWLWLHKRDGGWIFFPILTLASITHILSHAILICICSIFALADYFENKPLKWRHVILVASTLLSVIVYLLPSGPYQTMLHDIEQHHLKQLLTMLPLIGSLALAAVLIVMILKPHLYWREKWSRTVLQYILNNQKAISAALILFFFITMIIQASVLPAASWLPYGGSIGTFAVFQTGNIIFAAFFLSGFFHFLHRINTKDIEASNARALIWSLIAFSLLGLFTLGASFFMLDRNWLLRLINYAILFAAPIAAIGLSRIRILQHRPWFYLFLTPFFLISICQAIRPMDFLAC